MEKIRVIVEPASYVMEMNVNVRELPAELEDSVHSRLTKLLGANLLSFTYLQNQSPDMRLLLFR